MNAPSVRTELDYFVEAFEEAQQSNGGPPDLARFVPAPDHPYYAAILRELVCIDLDYGWSRGRPTPLNEYRRRFPALFTDPEGLRAVVWEDYRQRCQAGQEPDSEDYRRRYGVSPLDEATNDSDLTSTIGKLVPSPDELARKLDALGVGSESMAGSADLYSAVHRTDPVAAERYARAQAAMPEVGAKFLGFHLEAELGHGAFGRVYLARQSDLANRPVALKVATELFSESQTLAQLQHTNVMPIYSAHRYGPFQALCMPYFGGTTLAHLFKTLQGRSLPTSGKHFVSTLHDRKSATLPPGAKSEIRSPKSEARNPKSEIQGAKSEGGTNAISDFGFRASDLPVVPASLAALERQSYVDAVLSMAAKLADGLAHAHERGIVHRDLKPANVLLTDDGQPMLLDFNLSDDTKLRSSEAGARIGGTLPYMAPEQLSAFHHPTTLPIDGRGDLYTLGLIVYELLTGRHPFPVHPGSGEPVIRQMLTDRATPPLVRPFNSAVSPAVEAIVRRCLEPDPARRYQSVRDLKDDLERQLANLPLKHTPEPSRRERWSKFVRRHPRLTSAASVATVAAAVLLGVGVALNAVVGEVRQRRAADALRVFDAAEASVKPRLIRSLDTGSRAAAIDTARTAVAQYGVLDQPNWLSQRLVTALPPAEQERLRTRIGELLFLMTQARLDEAPANSGPERFREALVFNGLAGASYGAGERPRAWWEQRAEVLRRLGERDQAADLTQKAEHIPLHTSQDFYLHAVRHYEAGRYRDALADLERATADDPRHYWAWLMRGNCNYLLTRYDEAIDCFGRCIGIDDRQARAYYNRGQALVLLARDKAATDDFRRALDLEPDWTAARIELIQALAHQALKSPQAQRTKVLAEAEAELTRILEKPDAPVRCYFQRALVRRNRGNDVGAKADVAAGCARDPGDRDDLAWAIRGFYRKDTDPEKSLEDSRRAEQINPRNHHALRNQAYVLAGKPGRLADAVTVLDRLLDLYPDMPEALAERAVLLARLGKVAESVDDVKRLEGLSPRPLQLYQAACVYALTADRPGHAKEALRLLAVSLTWALTLQSTELNPVSVFETDSDLDQIRNDPEFRRLADGIRVLKSYWK